MDAPGRQVNESGVTRRLFEMITNSPESEQQTILKVLEKRPAKSTPSSMPAPGEERNNSGVTERLFNMIQGRTEDERQAILRVLEKRRHKGRRRHIRKPYFTVVNHHTQGRDCTDFIHNISAGGVFIATPMTFSLGKGINMAFPLPNYHDYIQINGEVVRTSPEGIGVQFTSANGEQGDKIRRLLQMV